MYCGRCGKPMDDNLDFCPSCNYDMRLPDKETEAEEKHNARVQNLNRTANKGSKLKRLLGKLFG